jgi:hypothetical protein
MVQQWSSLNSLPEVDEEACTVKLLRYQPFARAPWVTLYTGAQGYNSHMATIGHLLQTTEWASMLLLL